MLCTRGNVVKEDWAKIKDWNFGLAVTTISSSKTLSCNGSGSGNNNW